MAASHQISSGDTTGGSQRKRMVDRAGILDSQLAGHDPHRLQAAAALFCAFFFGHLDCLQKVTRDLACQSLVVVPFPLLFFLVFWL